MSVRTTRLVNISVDDELRWRGETKKQTVVEGALEVAEDPLHNHEMGLSRVIHVEAHLLDCVGDVEPGEGEVLREPRPSYGRRLGCWRGCSCQRRPCLSVDQCGAGLAVAHASALKDISSILALVEEEVIDSLLHWDAKEVVEGVEVLHGELLLESHSGMLEQLWAWGGEDDVINVEEQVRDVGATTIDEQRGVRLGLHKVERHQVGGKVVIPSSQHLLQTVEGSIEMTHQLERARSMKLVGWEQ
jgi:hypothetical protein